MVRRKQAADRAIRPKLRSPGHPKFQREVEVALWEGIAKGLLPEEDARAVGVSQPVGGRWFRHGGDMRPFDSQSGLAASCLPPASQYGPARSRRWPGLTAQEAQIATVAASGMTKPEIGAELFLSSHTVEWHLRKVHTKLVIRSRRELAGALPDAGVDGIGISSARA